MRKIDVGDIVKYKDNPWLLFEVEELHTQSNQFGLDRKYATGICIELSNSHYTEILCLDRIELATDEDIIKALQLEVISQEYKEAVQSVLEGKKG